MATVQIGVKIEENIKLKIDNLVELGKYRNVSDFIHKAVLTELNKDAATSEEFQRKLDSAMDRSITEGRYDVALDARVRKIFQDLLSEK